MSNLLPPNATGAEKALAETIARMSDIPVPVKDLWNTETCPSAVLPWLAWALSVDIWDPDWTEDRKREEIAESVDVHRRKGTVSSLRQAILKVIPDVVVSEWFQYGGEPYRFRVETTGDIPEVDVIQAVLLPAIEASKNVRSMLEGITIRRSIAGAVAFAHAVILRGKMRVGGPATLRAEDGSPILMENGAILEAEGA